MPHVPMLVDMKPTRRLRWRALVEPPGRRERSVLEQLWVDDERTCGEWRVIDRVDADAPADVEGRHLPDFL